MGWPEDYREQFWSEYPRRVAKLAAMRALERVRRSGEVSFEHLMMAVRTYAHAVAGKDMQYVAHPATWLNGGRWDDDPAALVGGQGNGKRTLGQAADDLIGRLRDLH